MHPGPRPPAQARLGEERPRGGAAAGRLHYPIQLEVMSWPIKMQTNRAMGASLKAQGLVALIGRDILRACVLVYNGGAGTFSRSI